jgi:hypothetical protein
MIHQAPGHNSWGPFFAQKQLISPIIQGILLTQSPKLQFELRPIDSAAMGFFLFESDMKDKDLRKSYHSLRCSVCPFPHSDPAHIKSYGSGGADSWENLLPLCRKHHSLQHQVGWRRMLELFPVLVELLWVRGWLIDDSGKLRRV